MKKEIDKEKALERLAGLCSRSEQCEYNLIQKLFKWGLPASDRKEIIDYLKENKYVDDGRYAKSYANDKARFSGWGPFKIRLELSKCKIPPQMIKEALDRVENSVWREGLLKNAESKAKNLDLLGEESYQNQQKLYAYLISRGFPSGASGKAVALMKNRQKEKEKEADGD